MPCYCGENCFAFVSPVDCKYDGEKRALRTQLQTYRGKANDRSKSALKHERKIERERGIYCTLYQEPNHLDGLSFRVVVEFRKLAGGGGRRVANPERAE